MKYTIAVIPGDGIGPEVTNQAKKALDAVAEVYDHIFLYKEAQMGACAIEKNGNPLPEETIEVCKNADAILYGAIGLFTLLLALLIFSLIKTKSHKEELDILIESNSKSTGIALIIS